MPIVFSSFKRYYFGKFVGRWGKAEHYNGGIMREMLIIIVLVLLLVFYMNRQSYLCTVGESFVQLVEVL